MPHCDVPHSRTSAKTTPRRRWRSAVANMARADERPDGPEGDDILWVYEIVRPGHEAQAADRPRRAGAHRRDPDARQRGRSIIRNEGIRETKARGRAHLTQVTAHRHGHRQPRRRRLERRVSLALVRRTRKIAAELRDDDERRIGIASGSSRGSDDINRFRPCSPGNHRAYVADGNHRSAAAAMLGTSITSRCSSRRRP